ncbi:NFATC2-interacting protein isoform X2 [Rhea pennata]|uniref:NFATC2-interacting protein isoform X2 n=1 Tax=Rhea pennata TaxID=8795 RepID=UPI002E25B117
MTEPSSVPPGCPEAVAVGPAAERGAAGDAPASTLPPWPRAHGGSSDSDSDVEGPRPPRRPRPKRRRLHLGPGVPSIPVYSNKVNSCFRLCPTAVQLRDLPAPQQQGEPPIDTDAEEEEEKEEEEEEEEEEEKDERKAEPVLEPEPSEGATIPVSPCSPQPRSSRTRRIIRDVDRRLRGLSSLVLGSAVAPEPDVVLLEPPAPPAPRLLRLKVQCRAELHRVPLQTSEPLRAVVEHMAQVLRVPPGRILLLLRDRELEPSATPPGPGAGGRRHRGVCGGRRSRGGAGARAGTGPRGAAADSAGAGPALAAAAQCAQGAAAVRAHGAVPGGAGARRPPPALLLRGPAPGGELHPRGAGHGAGRRHRGLGLAPPRAPRCGGTVTSSRRPAVMSPSRTSPPAPSCCGVIGSRASPGRADQ